METNELLNELAQHYGSQTYTRHWANKRFVLTEGAVSFRNNAGGGAHWLFDILATELEIAKLVVTTGFASVILEITDNNSGLLTVQQDDGIEPVYSNALNYTDCPPGKWSFYIELDENPDGTPMLVCLLPSEH